VCEFTVYLDGQEDSDIVATYVVKAVVKPDYVALLETSGKVVRIPNARIVKVDTIVADLVLETHGV